MNELKKLIASEKDAREFGFDWPNQEMIINQVIKECKEIEQDILAQAPAEKIQEEIGDLLHATISLCTFSGFSVEDTLHKTNHKFDKRMSALKELTQQQGLHDLNGQSFECMLELWKKAKKATSEEKKS